MPLGVAQQEALLGDKIRELREQIKLQSLIYNWVCIGQGTAIAIGIVLCLVVVGRTAWANSAVSPDRARSESKSAEKSTADVLWDRLSPQVGQVVAHVASIGGGVLVEPYRRARRRDRDAARKERDKLLDLKIR